MRNISLFLLSIIILESCGRNNDHALITIKYDYTKGFHTDTLKLSVAKKTFAATIDSITEPLDTYEELLTSKDFTKIFEHSTLYINNVIVYLADSSKPRDNKVIAVLSMQEKDYDNNLNFLCACDYLYKQNLVDEEMLFNILFPRLDLKNVDMIKYYQNEQIRNVLNDIKNNKKTSPDFKNEIQDILTGKTYKEQKDFLANQYGINI